MITETGRLRGPNSILELGNSKQLLRTVNIVSSGLAVSDRQDERRNMTPCRGVVDAA